MSNDRVHSTPPTNTPVVSTRRRFLTNAAGVAAGGTVLALATIPPTSALAASTDSADPSDERLVAAAEGLFAATAAIGQLCREYPDGFDDDGQVDERSDYQALCAVQDQHVETLVTVAATSNAGLQAKASVVAAKFMADGFRPDHKRLAISLANDLVGGARAEIPATPAFAAPADAADPIFSLIEAHRTAGAAYLVALEEQNRLDRIGDRSADWLAEEECVADMEAFNNLIETAPTTFAGLVAWASYLDEIGQRDGGMIEAEAPTLVATLVEALRNLAVVS
jgi:hypothetical protein